MIKVYAAEKNAGLEKVIASNRSLAYLAEASPDNETSDNDLMKTAAKFMDLPSELKPGDLYRINSVLVTSSWNLNDDVFSPQEVYGARDTPMHQPANINHDEDRIIGHIVATMPVDESYQPIKSEESLPDIVHLLSQAVVYTHFQGDARRNEVQEVIDAVEAGEMYVSMEALFNNFDYGLLGSDGQLTILRRNEDSAHISASLRAYGGTGEYKGMKVGRVLRNVKFVGKGFVLKPANRDSIIFPRDKSFEYNKIAAQKTSTFSDSRVISNVSEIFASTVATPTNNTHRTPMEKKKMAEDILKAENSELKAQLRDAQAEVKQMQERVAEANIKKLEDSIAKLEQELTEAKEMMKKKDESMDKMKKDYESKAQDASDLQEQLAEAKEQFSKLEKQYAAQARTAKLVSAGISQEDAESTVAKFEALNDEQFDAVAEALVEAAKAKMYSKDDEKKKKEMEDKAKAEDEDEDAEAAAAGVEFESEDKDAKADQADATSDDEVTKANVLRQEIFTAMGKYDSSFQLADEKESE